jgi:EmrB/QacA subfamily drug resistance transporter
MTRQQRFVLVVSILASFVAFLDGSVVNIALPAIAHELGGGLATQQWVVDAYLITLGSLILVAGSFSDLFGRKKVLAAGLLGFGVASVLCAVAPAGSVLILARGLQGIAGALLVPSSLALIISAFTGRAQGKAIGAWTAWTGIAFVIGPLLGGALISLGSWRWIFAINVLPIAVTLWLMKSLDPEKGRRRDAHIDIRGALLCVVGLGAPVYSLIEQSHYGWSSPAIYLPMILGVATLGAFLAYERHVAQPMLPLELFKVRNFSAGNLATVLIYGALSIATFLITVAVQQIGGYSALEAGLALLPVTLIMFFLSPRIGMLAGKFGPRLFMTFGPIIAGFGFLTMLRLDQHMHYWTQLLPGVLLFGLGLATTVAPLTSAVLGSISERQAGIGSAVNNAVARIAGLVGTAMIGLITGVSLRLGGVHRGMAVIAVLLFLGGIISWLGIRNVRTADSEQ